MASVDWPCEVTRDYADANLGLPARFETALDAVFAAVDRAIILEDDCLPDPSFFPFCAALLERYSDDPRVMAIAGARFTPMRGRASYSFSRFPHWTGWATWRRAWACYDHAMADWPSLRDGPWLRELLGERREARLRRGLCVSRKGHVSVYKTGGRTRSSRATPLASSTSATAPNDEPDRPGPSSTTACSRRGALAHAAARDGEEARVRAKGWPTGRTVATSSLPRAAATMPASAVPIERRPITAAAG